MAWCKVQCFCNSSSANILSMSILKFYQKKVIVPSLTWVSDINSVIINNFKPKFGHKFKQFFNGSK